MSDEEQRRIARKALVAMLYAHFEGLCKFVFSLYLERVSALGLKVRSATPALGAASMSDVFRAMRDPNKKCKEFVRQLPDDSALHRFARDREFTEVAWKFGLRTVELDVDDIADVESNLKPAVLRKILFRMGLDPKVADPWEGKIHELLNKRNDVAHGTATSGPSAEQYAALEQAVMLVVDAVVVTISDAVRLKAYLA